jgi:hypothetical protein
MMFIDMPFPLMIQIRLLVDVNLTLAFSQFSKLTKFRCIIIFGTLRDYCAERNIEPFVTLTRKHVLRQEPKQRKIE